MDISDSPDTRKNIKTLLKKAQSPQDLFSLAVLHNETSRITYSDGQETTLQCCCHHNRRKNMYVHEELTKVTHTLVFQLWLFITDCLMLRSFRLRQFITILFTNVNVTGLYEVVTRRYTIGMPFGRSRRTYRTLLP
jgi:hypothetical protein